MCRNEKLSRSGHGAAPWASRGDAESPSAEGRHSPHRRRGTARRDRRDASESTECGARVHTDHNRDSRESVAETERKLRRTVNGEGTGAQRTARRGPTAPGAGRCAGGGAHTPRAPSTVCTPRSPRIRPSRRWGGAPLACTQTAGQQSAHLPESRVELTQLSGRPSARRVLLYYI